MRGNYPVVLVPVTTSSASATGSTIIVPDGFRRVHLCLNVTAASGTSETLNVYLQNAITLPGASDLVGTQPTGALQWNDLVSFAQVTTSAGKQFASFIETSGFAAAAQDAALVANSIRGGIIGTRVRVKWVIAGTNPSYTFSLVGEFLP